MQKGHHFPEPRPLTGRPGQGRAALMHPDLKEDLRPGPACWLEVSCCLALGLSCFFIKATLVRSRYQASGEEGPFRQRGAWPMEEAAQAGWGQPVSTSSSALRSSQCPRPSRPCTPLSSGFFLCNLFFKKSLYYFFIRLQQLLPGAWGFIFVAGGGGRAICHFASVEHLGSIKTVTPSQCTLNLGNKPNGPKGPRWREAVCAHLPRNLGGYRTDQDSEQ